MTASGTPKISEQRLQRSLLDLNQAFRDRTLMPNEFYRILFSLGISVESSVLVGIFPDSGFTHCGTLIDQNGDLRKFDIDLTSLEDSELSPPISKYSGSRSDRRAIEAARMLFPNPNVQKRR